MTYSILSVDDVAKLALFIDRLPVVPDRELTAWKYFLKSLETCTPGIIVTTKQVNGIIVSATGCYSIAALWERPLTLMPYWVIGITRSLGDQEYIQDRLDNMMTPACTHFEAFGYNTFFMSRLISKKINYNNCEDYVNRLSVNTGIYRYKCSIEHLVTNAADYKTLSSMYKMMSHDTWPEHKQLAILRYDLKYEERK